MSHSISLSEEALGFFLMPLKWLASLARPVGSLNITVDLRRTRYPIFTEIASDINFNAITEDHQSFEEESNDEEVSEFDSICEKSDLIWSDCYISHDFAKNLKKNQKANHFPGSWSLGRKNLLYKNILKMSKCLPEEYNFLPRTWLYPLQMQTLKNMAKEGRSPKNTKGKSKSQQFYIVKPEASCQGRGIYLTKNLKKLFLRESNLVVQEYLTNPFLVDGLKFDLRLYVVVSSLNPLSVYLFKDGLVRFCTEKYARPNKENYKNLFMHLTNYAVNKNSGNFVQPSDLETEHLAHKRSFSHLLNYLHGKGKNIEKLLGNITDLILKTIISAYPTLLHDYLVCQPKKQSPSRCFEILGFDIFLDEDLKPWLLEVNHTPSFKTDSIIDKIIKKGLLLDTIQLANNTSEKIVYQGGLIRLFPSECKEYVEWIESLISNSKEVDAQDMFSKSKIKRAQGPNNSFYGLKQPRQDMSCDSPHQPIFFLRPDYFGKTEDLHPNSKSLAHKPSKGHSPVSVKSSNGFLLQASRSSGSGHWGLKKGPDFFAKTGDHSIFQSSTFKTYRTITSVKKQKPIELHKEIQKIMLTQELEGTKTRKSLINKGKNEKRTNSLASAGETNPKRPKMRSELIKSPIQYIRVKQPDGSYTNKQIQAKKQSLRVDKPISNDTTFADLLSNPNESGPVEKHKLLPKTVSPSKESVSLKVFNFHSIKDSQLESKKNATPGYKIKTKILRNPTKKISNAGKSCEESVAHLFSSKVLKGKREEPKRTLYLQDCLEIALEAMPNSDFSLFTRPQNLKVPESLIPDIDVSDEE